MDLFGYSSSESDNDENLNELTLYREILEVC